MGWNGGGIWAGHDPGPVLAQVQLLGGYPPPFLAGTVVATVWRYLDGGPAGIWDIQPATPGFLIGMSVGVAVCLLTPKPSREVVDLFDRVNVGQ